MKPFVLLVAAALAAACQDDPKEIVAPRNSELSILEATDAPLVRITSPLSGNVVATGVGRAGAGSLAGGSAFTIIIETVTGDAADVPANESINIRNTALLGQANPNFPGLSVLIDRDLIAPDGTIIPRNTNLANLFNTLGTDDSPGKGVTIWAGWHVLESFREDVKTFTITASVRDVAGRVGTAVAKVNISQITSTGQALTPAPTAVGGDGVADVDGPEVRLVGPRDPSSVALGTPTVGSFVFFQVSAVDRTGVGIGVNENGDGITNPVGLIRDAGQLATGSANRNFPGLDFHLRRALPASERGHSASRAKSRAALRHSGERAGPPGQPSRHHDRELGRWRLIRPARWQDIGNSHDARDRQRREDGPRFSHIHDQPDCRRAAVDSASVAVWQR
jgi:hypothetical protein